MCSFFEQNVFGYQAKLNKLQKNTSYTLVGLHSKSLIIFWHTFGVLVQHLGMKQLVVLQVSLDQLHQEVVGSRPRRLALALGQVALRG